MASEQPPMVCEISVSGDGISIQKSVPIHVALQIVQILMGAAFGRAEVAGVSGGGERVSNPGGLPTGGLPNREVSGRQDRRTSLREFLDDVQAKRNPDKITSIAEYLCLHEGMEVFSKEDLKGRFRSAGEAAPANFPRDFSWTVKNGWIAEDSRAPGSFYVTQKGRAAIGNRFSDEVKKATPKPSARRRVKRGAGSSNEEGVE